MSPVGLKLEGFGLYCLGYVKHSRVWGGASGLSNVPGCNSPTAIEMPLPALGRHLLVASGE